MIFTNESKKEVEELQKDINEERCRCNILFVSLSGKHYKKLEEDTYY